MVREVDHDDERARTARTLLRVTAPSPLRSDAPVERWLRPGEQLLARRAGATVDRRQPGSSDEHPAGDLYVTSERLVLAGTTPMAIALDDIEEAGLLGGDLVLLLHGGIGATIRCDRPRLLRVEISAARAARPRSEPGVGRFSDPPGNGRRPRPGS